MKQVLRLITLLAILMIGTITYAQSEPDTGRSKDDLNRLSAYLTGDTELYIALRTDDNYAEKLTAFLANLPQNWDIPTAEIDTQSAIYDLISIPFYGEKQYISGWLGDSVVLALPTLDIIFGYNGVERIPTILYEITDPSAADAYVNGVYSNPRLSVTVEYEVREDGIIHYAITDSEHTFYIQITDEIMAISSEFDYFGTLPETRLNESEKFAGIINKMPADGYDIIGYFDPTLLLDLYNNILYGYSRQTSTTLEQLAIQEIGFGINIYNDRSVVVDMVTANEALADVQSIDQDLIRFVPSNALFLFHTTTLGMSVEQFGASYEQAIKQFEMFGGGIEDEIPFDISHLLNFMELTFKGTTGITLEEFAEGLNGDWLFYVSSVANTANFLSVLRSSDSDKTDAVFDHVTDALSDVFAGTRYEDDILKFAIPVNPLFGDQEIWLGENDDLIVVGTQYDFKFEPNPTSVTMNTRAHYNDASAYFLSNPHALTYINFGQIRSLLDVLRQGATPSQARDYVEMIEILNGVESISNTSAQSDNYTQTRFVITFTSNIIR